MNIFATFSCPVKSAEYLDDQRLIKMTLESLQMLSGAASWVGLWQQGLPRLSRTHFSHPCAIWTRAGRSNFEWLYEHAMALDLERKRRWNKPNFQQHATLTACESLQLWRASQYLPYGQTAFSNSARHKSLGLDFTHLPVHRAYRAYLRARWMLQSKRLASCTVSFNR